ncbi:hypothetical protein PMAYCL1PPCAC_03757, partial [Pristionchus mayeri]
MLDSRYSLIVTIVLGIAHMCMFVGYDTGSFIVESVLHSVHDRRPTEMDEHAGYYGQAIVNAFNMVGHIIAPAILCVINAKWTMVIGSVFFTISFATYILMNEYVIYVSSAFLGLLFAVFNAGYSRYLTQISTVATIEKINGLEWSIACLSTLFGGFLYIPLTLMDPKSSEPSLYREYSDTQIRLMYGSFTVIGIISNLIFCFLPNRAVEFSIASTANVEEKGGRAAKIRDSITLTLKSFIDPLVLQLSPHFIYVGWQNSVWLSIYPTTLQFTESVSQNVLVTAYYGMAFSLGSLTMGTLMGPLSRRIVRFGQTPCLALAAGLQLICGLLILLSTPNLSTIEPNNDPSLLIPPNVPLALVMGFLFGLLDGCNNTNRTVMCATALPAKRPQVFAIARFYQALAGSILLFCSPLLTTYWMLGIEAILFLVGAGFYLRVVALLNQPHRGSKRMTLVVKLSVVVLMAVVVFGRRLLLAWRAHCHRKELSAKIPGDEGLPVLGNLLEYGNADIALSSTVPAMARRLRAIYGGRILKMWLLNILAFFPLDGQLAAFILHSSVELIKGDEYEAFEPWVGRGLIFSSGKKWHDRRKMLTHAFLPTMLEAYIQTMNKHAKVLVQVLGDKVGKEFDFFPYSKRCALDIICDTAMGKSLDAQHNPDQPYVRSIGVLMKLGMEVPFKPHLWFTIGR